jgi:uncharacterized membrane protein
MWAMTIGFVLVLLGCVMLFLRTRSRGASSQGEADQPETNRVWATASGIVMLLLGMVLIIVGASG